MVVSAYVLVEMKEEGRDRKGEAVLMRADNDDSAVSWVKKCQGRKKDNARVGALMRWMGVLESKGDWCFQARHVPGVENKLADGLARRRNR